MHSKKIILICALLATSMWASAQMVSYSVIQNDPDDYKKSMLYLDLFTGDTYLGMSLGGAVKLETMVGDRLMPWVQYKFSWADANTHHVVSGYPTNAGGLKKQRVIDIGTAYFLTERTAKKRVKMVLGSYSTSRYTHTRYIMVPAEVKKMFGFEGGILLSRRALSFDEDSHKFFHYKSTDGVIDSPIHGVGNSAGQPAGEYYKPLSMTRIFSLYGGIHYRKINNLTISTGGSNISNAHVTDLYVDAIFAPAAPIANVVDITGKEWILLPQGGAISHIGWRAGFMHHNSQKTAIEYGMEVGRKPGPVMGEKFKDNGGYLSVNAGFTIGSKKSISKPGKKKE